MLNQYQEWQHQILSHRFVPAIRLWYYTVLVSLYLCAFARKDTSMSGGWFIFNGRANHHDLKHIQKHKRQRWQLYIPPLWFNDRILTMRRITHQIEARKRSKEAASLGKNILSSARCSAWSPNTTMITYRTRHARNLHSGSPWQHLKCSNTNSDGGQMACLRRQYNLHNETPLEEKD